MRKAFSGIALAVLSFVFLVVTAGSSNATIEGVTSDTPTATVCHADATKAAKAGTLTDSHTGVKIKRINYNANGNDVSSNRWKEGVIIENRGSDSVDVGGWFIHDTYHNNGNFTNAFQIPNKCGNDANANEVILDKGETVLVTPSNSTANLNNAATFVFAYDFVNKGYNGHIWNNNLDTATLVKGVGTTYPKFPKASGETVVHSKSYNFENGYYIR